MTERIPDEATKLINTLIANPHRVVTPRATPEIG